MLEGERGERGGQEEGKRNRRKREIEKGNGKGGGAGNKMNVHVW